MSIPDFEKLEAHFAEWDKLRELLAPLYKTKDNSRSLVLGEGIALLGEAIELAKDAAPVNFQERFNFIEDHKHNYTAFKQLDELFKETKKKVAVLRLRQTK